MRVLPKILGPVVGRRAFVLNERAGGLLENFFIAAVVSILVIRLYIRLFAETPVTTQFTVRLTTAAATTELHFAHVLWGGLLMLVALVLALAFLGRFTRQLAAVLGGIGFGAFIDELGKFITVDNDYFFQPTIALIYVTMVLLFIVTRALRRPRRPSRRDVLANALEVAKLAVIGDAGKDERDRAIGVLSRYPPRDRAAQVVRRTLQHLDGSPKRETNLLELGQDLVTRMAQRVVSAWWFARAVVAFFVFQSLGNLYQTLAAIDWSGALFGWLGANAVAIMVLYTVRHRSQSLRAAASAGIVLMAIVVSLLLLTHQQDTPEPLSTWLDPVSSKIEPGTGFQDQLINVIELLQVTSPLISNVLVVFGILFIWHSRLTAYRLFHHAILISILLTQVFVFHEDQLMGVVGLLPNLVVLAILRYLIRSEGSAQEPKNSDTGHPARVQTEVPAAAKPARQADSEGRVRDGT